MKIFRYKIITIILALLAVLFFSNDFGIVDIERTEIITALGIDKSGQEYTVTAQIATPKPNGHASENEKSLISANAKTVGLAIREIGKVSGWYPKLAFCNLVVIGKDLLNENVIDSLGYFEKTLRIQDSALVAAYDGTAKELFSQNTPLDNISSFALQKILIKRPNKATDVFTTDVKTFVTGYSSYGSTSMMPFIKSIKGSESEKAVETAINNSGANSSEQDKSANTFDATTTLLFKKGVCVGKMEKPLTYTFNLLNKKVEDNYYAVEEPTCQSLLSIQKNKCKIKLHFKDNLPIMDVSAKFFCHLEDSTKEDPVGTANLDKIPTETTDYAKLQFIENVKKLYELSTQTECDIFSLTDKLYRFNHKYYDGFKNDIVRLTKLNVNVNFYGIT